MKRLSVLVSTLTSALALSVTVYSNVANAYSRRSYNSNTQYYSCVSPNGYGKSLSINFSKDRRTVTLIDYFGSSVKLKLMPSLDSHGDLTYQGIVGCSQKNPGAPHCFMKALIQLRVSPQLSYGQVKGRAELNSQQYACEAQ